MSTFNQHLSIGNILSGVRATVLGLTTTQELPLRPPYGFWVDRSGNYKTVASFSTGGHDIASKEIIMAAYDYKKETGQLTQADEHILNATLSRGYIGLNNALEDINFMHVVKCSSSDAYRKYHHYCSDDNFFYSVINITPSQQKFLTNLYETYNIEVKRVYRKL